MDSDSDPGARVGWGVKIVLPDANLEHALAGALRAGAAPLLKLGGRLARDAARRRR